MVVICLLKGTKINQFRWQHVIRFFLHVSLIHHLNLNLYASYINMWFMSHFVTLCQWGSGWWESGGNPQRQVLMDWHSSTADHRSEYLPSPMLHAFAHNKTNLKCSSGTLTALQTIISQTINYLKEPCFSCKLCYVRCLFVYLTIRLQSFS